MEKSVRSIIIAGQGHVYQAVVLMNLLNA